MIRRWRAARSEAGFTLIELLLTIVILGVITLPLANFVINYFLSTTTTAGRLSESHDEQIATAYFAADVSSIGVRDSSAQLTQSVWTGSFPAGSCGSSAAAADQILLLKWDDVTWTGSAETDRTDSAAYIRVAASGETQLHRLYCQGATQISDVVLVHNLGASPPPTVTCTSTCTAAAVPSGISLQLRISVAAGRGDAMTMTLNGQRRQT